MCVRGVRALAKLLDGSSVISLLELHDNQIHTEGAKSLARAFKNNKCLLSVNLRLNRMGDEGCKVGPAGVRQVARRHAGRKVLCAGDSSACIYEEQPEIAKHAATCSSLDFCLTRVD